MDIANTEKSWQDVYSLCITFVTPRPIGFISTVAADGVRNLAPFSFFNMVCARPPILMFCPGRNRAGAKKDTLVNVEATGEFVAAVVTDAMGAAMNQTSAAYAPEVDEFAAAGFTPRPATMVQPALVGESPVNCECRLERIVEFGEGPGATAVVFGRVVAIHVDDRFLAADGLLDDGKLLTIGRMGRSGYVRTTDRFDLPRPTIG
ncbi:MAG: flavin reductase family protein [Phycisphaerales bacterium]|nr:flavin reductase family protein [bacterium]MCB9865039.1 flavin reductase family protein [Phycisphaerales bacterium]